MKLMGKRDRRTGSLRALDREINRWGAISALHCPILGDITYGGKKVMEVGGVIVPRVMLHAKVLGFIHPVTEQEVLLKAPLPEDIVGVTTALQQVTASV